MKLNLRVKLLGSFGIILFLMVVVGLVGIYTSKTIQDRMDNIIEKDIKPANIMGDVGRRVGLVRANALLHLVTHSIDDMNRYESEVADWIDKVNTDLNTLENIFEDQAALDKLAEFRTAWETYLKTWREQVVPLSRANRDEEAFALARKTGAGGMAAREAMYKLDELHDVNVAAANHRQKLASQDSMKSQYILSAIILLAIIFGLSFGARQGSLIAGSVNIVAKAAQLVAAGDLDQRVMIKTGDEIESMANSFNTMTVKLKTKVEELQSEIAKRKLVEEELAKHRENLEELIKHRTEELQQEIIERKQTEEVLRENETFIKTVMDNLPIGMAVNSVDPTVNFIYMNDNFPKFYRTTREALVKENAFWDSVYEDPDYRHEIKKRVLDDCASSDPGRMHWEDVPITRKGEETAFICAKNTPVPDKKLMISVVWDVTQRKRAEDSLRESEAKYRNLTESLDALIYRADPETLVVSYVNNAVEKIYGYTIEEWLDDPTLWESTIHPEDKEKVFAWFTQAQRNMESIAIEYRIIRKDKTSLWVEDHASWEKDQQGNVVSLNGVISNITERKWTEDILKQSEEKYRTMIEFSNDAIWTLDKAGNLTFFNEQSERLIGLRLNDWIGKSLKPLIIEEDFPIITGAFKRCSKGESLQYQARFKKQNKDILTISVNTAPILKNGIVHGTISFGRDITEQRKLETQLRQAQKMESVGRLAGGVAHDYNNALTAIMGFTELAMMDADPAGPLHADLNQVLKAGRRAQDITRQLLAFARKQTIAPIALNLNQTVESMIKMLQRLIGEDIDLVWLPGTNLWPVKMDPSQIDQILANLCVNARDAIDGVGKITIETDLVVLDKAYCANHVGFVPGEFVLMSVSDNGCGMDKEILKKIFEPFFTTKDVDKGTGLGLATVYGIVKQNNGFINVYSEPGKGTTIKIYLPRDEGEAVEIQEEITGTIPQGRGETILVVEDDLPILKLAQKILEGLNYTVLIADTPKEAMKLAKEHTDKIHLLITDVIMPEMNGRELSEHLQSLFPDLKCIFMSGYTSNAIAHHGVLDQGVHFIQKPFSKRDLATIVRKVLDIE